MTFGGEPLMNWDVVKQLVNYARSIEKKIRTFCFTLTTNGMLIDDDVIEFANREMSNVVLSLDGKKGNSRQASCGLCWKWKLGQDCSKISKFVAARGNKIIIYVVLLRIQTRIL